MDVTIYNNKKISHIKFVDGGKVAIPLEEIGTTNRTGTKITFLPDEKIFSSNTFSYTTLRERLQESAFLLGNLIIDLQDVVDQKHETFHYENGLESFVEYINQDKEIINKPFIINAKKNNIEVSIALQYTQTYSENILSFVNNVKTVDGGSHEVGFKTGITKVFNEYARNNNILKNKEANFEGSDVREGLTAIINLKIPESILQFEGQTKGKLGTPEARAVVESITYDYLKYYLEENREIALKIVEKTNTSKMAREAARKARDDARNGRGKKKDEKNMAGKLTPAQTKNPKINEIFIVEGNSAGGTAKKSRDRKFQAILPIRGKIINTEKATINDIFKNEEINSIIYCLGAGCGSDFELKDCNYDKVIIMTDADDDGAHIQCLLLTFFYRFMRPLIEAGKLYIAIPPLFKVTTPDKKSRYFFPGEENELKEHTKDKNSYQIQRYKGLGEMNPEPLWETTMDPKQRNLIKVNINDGIIAERRVSVLMGDFVEPRKEWINENVEFSLEDNYTLKKDN